MKLPYNAVVMNKGLATHDRHFCAGQICCLHNPMRQWPVWIRFDKFALAERVCKHSVGHPDPDSLAWLEKNLSEDQYAGLGIHGCDGCCSTKRGENDKR
jgi:hypothetical protein